MIFAGIAVLIFCADWYMKMLAEKHLEDDVVREAAGGWLLLRKLHNQGIALGKLSDKPRAVLWTTAAVAGTLLLSFTALLHTDGQKMLKAGYAMLLGGGLNNLADRKKNGYVRDYFSFNVRWKKLQRLVFNLSDIFIFLGAALMVIGELVKKNK